MILSMNSKMKRIIRTIFYPFVLVRRYFLKYYMNYLQKHDLKRLAGLIYKLNFGRRLNWDNPQNLSEKINWMKFNSDTSKWTELADKYKVRDYVASKGLSDILVQLYGVWERAEDIDFDTLPKSFVLKTNHACGTVLLVEDKSKINESEIRGLLNKWLNITIGKETAEPHYLAITPLIIAEEYLKTSSGTGIVDYKLFTVSGKTELVMVCSDRKIGIGASISLYDSNWNFCPERLGACHAGDGVAEIAKPASFDLMKEYAEILCKEFPFVRMDFYDIDGKVYFGEMTFTPKGGYCSTLTDEESLRIGKLIRLSLPINKEVK